MRWMLSLAICCLCSAGAHAGQPQPLRTGWDDLAGADAAWAYQALWRFAAQPDAAVTFFREHLKPAVRPEPQRLRKLVSELDSEDFAERDAATRALEKLDDLAEETLRAALKQPVTLEAKRRIETLLDRLDRPTLLPEERRMARAVEVLETIGSAAARALLQDWAKGAPGGR